MVEVSVMLAGAKFGVGLVVVELAAKLIVPVKRLRLLTVRIVLLLLPAWIISELNCAAKPKSGGGTMSVMLTLWVRVVVLLVPTTIIV